MSRGCNTHGCNIRAQYTGTIYGCNIFTQEHYLHKYHRYHIRNAKRLWEGADIVSGLGSLVLGLDVLLQLHLLLHQLLFVVTLAHNLHLITSSCFTLTSVALHSHHLLYTRGFAVTRESVASE